MAVSPSMPRPLSAPIPRQTEQLHRCRTGDATKGYLRVNLYLFDEPLYLLLMSLS